MASKVFLSCFDTVQQLIQIAVCYQAVHVFSCNWPEDFDDIGKLFETLVRFFDCGVDACVKFKMVEDE